MKNWGLGKLIPEKYLEQKLEFQNIPTVHGYNNTDDINIVKNINSGCRMLDVSTQRIFDKALMPFWKTFLWLKQLFNAKLLISRLPSFSVPKITVVRHV